MDNKKLEPLNFFSLNFNLMLSKYFLTRKDEKSALSLLFLSFQLSAFKWFAFIFSFIEVHNTCILFCRHKALSCLAQFYIWVKVQYLLLILQLQLYSRLLHFYSSPGLLDWDKVFFRRDLGVFPVSGNKCLLPLYI